MLFVLSSLLPLSSYAQTPLAAAEASVVGTPAAPLPAATLPVDEREHLQVTPIVAIPTYMLQTLYTDLGNSATGVMTTRTPTPALSIQEQLRAVPGVQVTPYSGMPGAWAAVRIRGATSAFGNPEPLYILDGFPVFTGSLGPDMSADIADIAGPMPNPLLALSAEDIERVEVVSGAAATARYGSQGANGVVVLTTRLGVGSNISDSTKARVRYAAHLGVQQVRRRYALLDANEYAGIYQEAKTSGVYQGITPGSVDTPTDWQREIFRTALTQQHYVALDGRSLRGARYTVSADYLRQDGVVKQSDLRRFTSRATAEKSMFNNRLTLRATVLGSQTDERRVSNTVINSALFAPPTQPIRTADGRYNMGTGPNAPFGFTNPVLLADYDYQTPRTRTLLAQGTARYAFSEALNLTVRTGYERTRTELTAYYPEYSLNSVPTRALEDRTTDATTTSRTVGLNLAWSGSIGRQYEHTLGLEASLLGQYVERETNSQRLSPASSPGFYPEQRSGIVTIAFITPALFARDEWRGLTGELGVRLSPDPAPFGSSATTYLYPSAQVSWEGRRTTYFASKPVLKDLMLWAGAGRTGAANLGPYAPAQLPAYSPFLGGGSSIGLVTGNLTGARGVYVDQVEIGGRLAWATHWRGSLTAYSRHSYSQSVVGVLLPSGANLANLGIVRTDQEVRNRGLEVAITHNWHTPASFAGRTTLAVSFNQNRILKDGRPNDSQYQADQFPVAGQPLSAFYGYQQQGVYPAGDPRAGQIRYLDRNGDGQAGAPGDATYLGSGLPRQLVCLTQNLRKGRWSADVQLDGMFGYQVFTYARLFLDVPTGSGNSSTAVRDRWSVQNPDSDVPDVVGAWRSVAFSERVLSSGSHVRLTQAIVSFEVWQDEQKSRTISIWTGGLNLLVISPYKGFDPNVSTTGATGAWAGHDNSAYPVARTWQIGVRATL